MAMPTLLDIAAQSNADAVPLIDEVSKANPEISGIDIRTGQRVGNVGASMPMSGVSYRTCVRVSLGNNTGSFRNAGAGSTPHRHGYINKVVSTFILHPRWECDKAIADRHPKGSAYFIAQEAIGTLEGEMQALSKQFYYGADSGLANLSGFPGLLDAYDATNMVIDAGGTTDNVASSVWLVKWGDRDVQWVWGQDGALDMSPVRVESILDPADSTKRFDGYVQTMNAYPGLQVGSTRSIVRIKKLTTDSGKGLTDTLLANALALFATGVVPDVILMSRRSLNQLRNSRTATNPTGAPAPFPTEAFGIPILPTDGILNTETLAL